MEFVFVVPREKLFPEHYPHGVVFFGEGLDEAQVRAAWCDHGFFVERAYAERTPSLKQVIPYTVVTR
jgi:predicted NUDIX family phosphoesterase